MYIIYRVVGAGHARPAAFTAAAPLSNGFAGKGLDRLTAPPYNTKQGKVLPCPVRIYCAFFCFLVSTRCRIASTGWWNSIRGPLQRMTWRICSRISGL